MNMQWREPKRDWKSDLEAVARLKMAIILVLKVDLPVKKGAVPKSKCQFIHNPVLFELELFLPGF